MILRSYGGPEVLERGEIEAPRVGPGDVLVRVRGSSVNPVDAAIRAGMLRTFVRLRLPAVLGVDVAGEVEETGPGVTRFVKGDRVFAFTGIDRGGGWGELVALPEGFLAKIPTRLSWAEAGTVPGVGATAYEAFTIHAPLRQGMRVLVNGGAGGVGTWAIQIAKALGAEVSATSSGEKAGLLRELGADHAIDYRAADPFGSSRGSFDVVLNNVRGAELGPMRELLRPSGALVTVTGDPIQNVASGIRNAFSSQKTIAFTVQTSGAVLSGLADLIANGRARPVLERTYGWSELADAHRRVETGRVAGKLAVVPD